MTQEPRIVMLRADGTPRNRMAVAEAIDLVTSQDQIAWIVDVDGKRIAAIVPVDVAEYHENMISEVLGTPVGRRIQFPQVTVELSGTDSRRGMAVKVADAMRAAGLDERTVRNASEAVMGCKTLGDVFAFLLHTVNVR